MIHTIPTFQACKSSLYRNRAKTTQELPTLQEETLMVHRLHISWRKVPPPWRHWCPRAQNPDILNGFKHSIFVCSGDSVNWWNLLLVYRILYTAIHPACQCQWNHVSPHLWAFTEQEWDDLHPFLCVIEHCWRMQNVISSLCYCLNIGYRTSKSLQDTLCTPTSLRQQWNDVFPLYAVHMEEGTILWIGCAVSRGWWLPSPRKKNDCSYFSTWTPSRCVVGGWMCCVLKTTW